MNIEIKNLTMRYPRADKKALDSVTITIPEGIYGLIGRNGAGKTTLMRILATVLDATEGEILVDGRELTAARSQFRTSLGYLPQSTKLMPRLNIVEFLDYVCILKGIQDKTERRERIAAVIETVGLKGEEKKRLGRYSGGMLRRAGIAQVLIGDPKVLIIDEPTTGLDPEERLYFLNLLSRIAEGRIVIFPPTLPRTSPICAPISACWRKARYNTRGISWNSSAASAVACGTTAAPRRRRLCSERKPPSPP